MQCRHTKYDYSFQSMCQCFSLMVHPPYTGCCKIQDMSTSSHFSYYNIGLITTPKLINHRIIELSSEKQSSNCQQTGSAKNVDLDGLVPLIQPSVAESQLAITGFNIPLYTSYVILHRIFPANHNYRCKKPVFPVSCLADARNQI